jgi:tRNA A37 methylthiotransferase MiaB
MFGFPGEDKEDFLKTIGFLKANKEYIDLVSTTVFGLQRKSLVFEHPDDFGVTEIKKERRTLLDEKISYKVSSGLQNEEAKKMRKNYIITLRKLNKLPKVLNYFKEQTLII